MMTFTPIPTKEDDKREDVQSVIIEVAKVGEVFKAPAYLGGYQVSLYGPYKDHAATHMGGFGDTREEAVASALQDGRVKLAHLQRTIQWLEERT